MRKVFMSMTMILMMCLLWGEWVYCAPGCQGNWLGSLKVPGAELRLVIRISGDAAGNLTAKMDSPDQGARDIPVDMVVCDATTVKLTSKRIQGAFEGNYEQGGYVLKGTWRQGGMSLPLELRKVEQTPQLRRPQTPQKPYPYQEEEVVFVNRSADVRLAGTLTLPKTEGRFPAVLLITGSGAQDRNETIFHHQPFLVLADYLTRLGFVVLRFDDRGFGKSGGDYAKATTQDFAEDVLAGVEYLKSRKEIDGRKIGLLGHSEGGIVAPMVAVRSGDVRFLVLLAGMGLTGEETLLRQGALIGRASGISEESIARNQTLQRKLFAVVKEEKDSLLVEKRLMEILKAEGENRSEAEKQALSDTVIAAQIKTINSPWFRFFLSLDPKPVLQKVTCPVLALNGEKDLQVPADENLAAIREALQSGGNKKFLVEKMPGLNHLFQHSETGNLSEYGKNEETISPEVMKRISDWLSTILQE